MRPTSGTTSLRPYTALLAMQSRSWRRRVSVDTPRVVLLRGNLLDCSRALAVVLSRATATLSKHRPFALRWRIV